MGVRAGADVTTIGGKVVMSMTIGDDELSATSERSVVVIIKCFSRHHLCLTIQSQKGMGIGGVLMQEGKPIAYCSEKSGGAQYSYHVYDKE